MSVQNVSTDRMARIQEVIAQAQSRSNGVNSSTEEETTVQQKRVVKTALPTVGTMFQKIYGENIADKSRDKMPTLGTLFDAYA